MGYVLDRWVELSQTFVVNEVAELRRQGVGVVVVALHEAAVDPDQPALYLRRTAAGRSVQARSHLRWAVRSPLRYLAFLLAVGRSPERHEIAWRRLPAVADQLREQQVDRLHAHFAWAGAGAAQALSTLTGWPWALTVHARDIYAPRPGVQRKLQGCNLLVTVCRYNVEILRDQLHVRRPVELVVCGVTPPPVMDVQPIVDVLAVGRLVEKKGFDLLVRAFAAIADEHPSSSLEIIGAGPLESELQDLVRALGIAGRVRLPGPLPHRQVLDRVAAARVFCLPARIAADGDADSMPVVIKEAMARSVPVVASAITAIPEMVDDEVGLLVPPEDVERLAQALRTLLGDPDLCRRLGAAGRARVEASFTLADEVRRLRGALERMSA